MAHLSSNSWRPQRLRRSRPSGISRRELYTMLIYVILMLIAILVGMYVGWWSLVREEEEEILPPAQTHSQISQLCSKVI
jgi:uncharacterized protein YneF (UPF0154 family)